MQKLKRDLSKFKGIIKEEKIITEEEREQYFLEFLKKKPSDIFRKFNLE